LLTLETVAVAAGGVARESQDVGDVLGPARGPLVRDEVVAADEGHDHTTQDNFDVPTPGSIEVHARDLREQVDAIRRVSQLHDAIVRCQVVVLDTDISEAELVERDQQPVGVGGVCPDSRIEVTGRPWQAVRSKRVAAHDHLADVMPSE
jgi:hypothetical protein